MKVSITQFSKALSFKPPLGPNTPCNITIKFWTCTERSYLLAQFPMWRLHPFSAVQNYLFNIITAVLHPEAASSSRYLWTSPAVATRMQLTRFV